MPRKLLDDRSIIKIIRLVPIQSWLHAL